MPKFPYAFDPAEYKSLIQELKLKIRSAQVKASLSVNRELVLLYWEIGKCILERQKKERWGRSVVERLSNDLRREFPSIRGFSARNLWDMRRFYAAYQEREYLRQLVADIPWGQNLVILNSLKDHKKRVWYIQQTIRSAWSRAVLIHQIESRLYERQAKGEALTNFKYTLPPVQSDLAQELMKDPYNFEFLSFNDQLKERDLQRSLLERLKEFLVELGVGFAFVGSEYRLEVGGQEFYLDLLFYHLKLRCYVVIELKTVAFQPEFAGKMNFYLAAVDDLMTQRHDKPSIGIILCKDKNKTIVEYALRDVKKPIGVSSYMLTEILPKKLAGHIPSAEELVNKLGIT